ncbi:MAG: isocitrate/isopropylmalate dehydrogenase family protein [Clostridia bacterium]|nr:isocitrate/isopropylmalate dehydrogenase family protein [Clostridia bacterium]
MDYIESAVEHFRGLLTEQLERCERMEKDAGKTDFSSMDEIKIGICGGDGIGPIITNEAMRLLSFLLEDDVASGKIKFKVIDGLTIENREACGKAIPDDVLAELKECPVILKGPTTTPKGGTMESANVAMRRELDLYANVRPVQVPSEGIDWIFFRENTEGEYVLGSKGIEIPDKLAFDFKVTTNPGTKRIVRAACEYARANGKTNLAIVTKANIMKKTDGKFSLLAHEIADEYPEITAEDWYIDIMTANLVNEARRSEFQVFVLPNLYGDIITDEAAQIQGGVGTAGSANIGDRYAMFEAIHGSAPRMIERGDGDYANPASMFKAAEMLLRHIGYADKADLLSKAMNICLETEKKITITGRSNGATCKEFGDYVMDTVKSLER